ncbi:helix-turn-helix transcriptional regulator [Mammaliicoccus sciuri]|uniref:helix-turn-helix domain-containing protein n=1 Tax=Mammaliicoccus sciuri TaxID=1296 RepID=UPI001FB56025|nr:helix-turn-helix transcriptional regulator [Mammaliicoccus sciuri]MCJ0933383.1 helix-turn-helix transcriptional regulator [Mammaliicoccus sciuri]
MKNRLSVLLGMKRVTVSKLSDETGISRSTLHSLYHERTVNPDTQTVMTICKYLGVTPNEFFGIEPIKQLKEV